MNYKHSVLVLDDHEFSCKRISSILEEAGFSKVKVAHNGEQALALMHTEHFDIVIMDIMMPDMDGVQFISRLVMHKLTPMLALSSACSRRIMNSVSLMAKEVGLFVLDAFSKPFAYSDALAIIKKLNRSSLTNSSSSTHKNDQHLVFDKQSLKSALELGQIQAWFQPKKALRTGEISGAEALARWHHSEHGFILPGSFIAAIQHHKLELQLLKRMFEDALVAHREWQSIGYTIPISINLPVPLLEMPSLPDELEQLAHKNHVPTSNITFELLEDETTSAPEHYYMGASRLRLKGFGLAQDDFGKGYSSMYNLIAMPFTELKIDRAFVTGASHDAVRGTALTSAVQLGKQLGLTVTAEGVETIEDLDFLRRIGCDCAQGFLISSAIQSISFGNLLIRDQRRQSLPPDVFYS